MTWRLAELVDVVVETPRVKSLVFDVTDWGQASSAIEGAGRVDILVNNAGNAGTEGFTQLVDFVDSDPADWQRFFAVNLFGVMHCTRAVLPSMIATGWGRIVTVISDADRGWPLLDHSEMSGKER